MSCISDTVRIQKDGAFLREKRLRDKCWLWHTVPKSGLQVQTTGDGPAQQHREGGGTMGQHSGCCSNSTPHQESANHGPEPNPTPCLFL